MVLRISIPHKCHRPGSSFITMAVSGDVRKPSVALLSDFIPLSQDTFHHADSIPANSFNATIVQRSSGTVVIVELE
jgi:hypothetical protein